MSNFYTDVICKSPLFKTLGQVRDVNLLETKFRASVIDLVSEAQQRGHDLRIIETYRSKERQMMLFRQGATKLAHVGVHHYGLAVDFGLFVGGKYVQSSDEYKFLLDLCAKRNLISGIDWGNPKKKPSLVDGAHVQAIPLSQQTALFSGAWYPSAA